jgi:predicted RNA binding protein YcfA (HicA-like mRNA interferase family)
MTNPIKLYRLLVEGRAGVLSFRDFEALLRAFGFAAVRQKGSHAAWRHPFTGKVLIIQPRDKDAKPYQVQQFMDMIEGDGLSIEDQ